MMASTLPTSFSSKALELTYENAIGNRFVTVDSVGDKKIVEHREDRHLHPRMSDEEPLFVDAEVLWSRIRKFMQEPFSEFFGVFVMMLFGDGVVAQVVLSSGTKGDWQSINWCWG